MILTHGANSLPVGGDITSITIGGRVYPVVDINGVKWLGENLDFKWEGLTISSATSSSEPRACYYNNNESTYGVNGRRYGLLYNYLAVKYLNDHSDEFFPGWHVTTLSDWQNAVAFAGDVKKLKSAVYFGGTDDYGLGIVPGGYKNASGFNKGGSYGDYRIYPTGQYTDIIFDSGNYFRSDSSASGSLMSVRLVKDA